MSTENVPPSRTAEQFVVRFPDGMRDRIAEEAKAANRSMNADIVARLQQSFDFESRLKSLDEAFTQFRLDLVEAQAIKKNLVLEKDNLEDSVKRLSSEHRELTRQLNVEHDRVAQLESELSDLKAQEARVPDLLREVEVLKSLDAANRTIIKMTEQMAGERESQIVIMGAGFLELFALLPEELKPIHKGFSDSVAENIKSRLDQKILEGGIPPDWSKVPQLLQANEVGAVRTKPPVASPLTATQGSISSAAAADAESPVSEPITNEPVNARQRPKGPWWDRGFVTDLRPIDEEGHSTYLWQLTIPNDVPRKGDEVLIQEEIEHRARMDGSDSTIWLDIQGKRIPDSVLEAIKLLSGFGAGIVVTLAGKSTLSSPESFSPEVMRAIRRSMRGGLVWCPIEKKYMHAPHGIDQSDDGSAEEQVEQGPRKAARRLKQ